MNQSYQIAQADTTKGGRQQGEDIYPRSPPAPPTQPTHLTAGPDAALVQRAAPRLGWSAATMSSSKRARRREPNRPASVLPPIDPPAPPIRADAPTNRVDARVLARSLPDEPQGENDVVELRGVYRSGHGARTAAGTSGIGGPS